MLNVEKKVLKKQREDWIDICRGILIVLVVLGHTSFKYGNFFYYFHLQGFFFLSGYLFKNEKYTNDIFSLIKNRIKRLYIPFVCFELLYWCFHNYFITIGFYGSHEVNTGRPHIIYGLYTGAKALVNILIGRSPEELAGPLWFLPTLLIMEMSFVFIKKISNKFVQHNKVELGIVSCMFALGYFLIEKKAYPLFDYRALYCLPFFYFGNLFSRNREKISFSVYVLIAVVALLTVYFSIGIRFVPTTNPVIFLTIAILFIYVVVYVSKFIENRRFGLVYSFLGKYTVPILALHFLIFKVTSLLFIRYFHSDPSIISILGGHSMNIPYDWVFYTFNGILVSIAISFLFTKTIKQPVMKYLSNLLPSPVLGKRDVKA